MAKEKKMLVPFIAKPILTRLQSNGGSAQICADDFGLDFSIFKAELERMLKSELIVPLEKMELISVLGVFDSAITANNEKILIAITNVGEEWLRESHIKLRKPGK